MSPEILVGAVGRYEGGGIDPLRNAILFVSLPVRDGADEVTPTSHLVARTAYSERNSAGRVEVANEAPSSQ